MAALGHQIPLEVVPELVVSVGNLPNQGTRLRIGVIENVVQRRPQDVRAEFRGQAGHAQFRALERSEHGQYVAPVLVRNPAVSQENP